MTDLIETQINAISPPPDLSMSHAGNTEQLSDSVFASISQLCDLCENRSGGYLTSKGGTSTDISNVFFGSLHDSPSDIDDVHYYHLSSDACLRYRALSVLGAPHFPAMSYSESSFTTSSLRYGGVRK